MRGSVRSVGVFVGFSFSEWVIWEVGKVESFGLKKGGFMVYSWVVSCYFFFFLILKGFGF